ncbi:MAG TPA: biotin--[acetyl-CoA-carboxylase] ligase [Rhizomicrobium sp.]|nr:biotin--[acetyl-CoA-carboxylase] ligase [Rhizomicrobium sp.]
MTAWPAGYGLIEFEEIDSTNEEARRRAARGERGPVWIVARLQTAGRGRRGRKWDSPSGNLAATLLLSPDRPARDCAQLSFVTALAVADVVAGFAPDVEVEVKWPNDVLIHGRKISGILLESASQGAEPVYLAIGVGINLGLHPSDTEFPATSLSAVGVLEPMPRHALLELAGRFAKWYEVWRAEGFLPIRDAWLARAAGLGKRIRARLTNEETVGVFEGIDETGALLLRETQDRVHAIAAGEVYFG